MINICDGLQEKSFCVHLCYSLITLIGVIASYTVHACNFLTDVYG